MEGHDDTTSEIDQQSLVPYGGRQITLSEYVELLIDASMDEAKELEGGFFAWCKAHVVTWKKMGRDETWIRERIAKAQSTRRLHHELMSAGYTEVQRRELLRDAYAASAPELYQLMLEREQSDSSGPHVSIIYGTADDILQRYVLRQLVFEADRANQVRFWRWQGLVDEEQLAARAAAFRESPDDEFIRDLSTEEELMFALHMAQRLRELLERPQALSPSDLESALHQAGKELRAQFVSTYGYNPEQSTTPRVAVTRDGPEDADEYRLRHSLE